MTGSVHDIDFIIIPAKRSNRCLNGNSALPFQNHSVCSCSSFIHVSLFRNRSTGVQQAFRQCCFSCVYMGENSNIDYFHVIVLLLQPQKGIKIPSSKILLPLGIIICGHTHIQHTPICDCCFLGYVKIDKAKVFLNWVQKTKPPQKGLS